MHHMHSTCACLAQLKLHINVLLLLGNAPHCWLQNLLRKQHLLFRLCSASCGNAAVGDMLDA